MIKNSLIVKKDSLSSLEPYSSKTHLTPMSGDEELSGAGADDRPRLRMARKLRCIFLLFLAVAASLIIFHSTIGALTFSPSKLAVNYSFYPNREFIELSEKFSKPLLISKIIYETRPATPLDPNKNESLPLCQAQPPGLGPVKADKNEIPIWEVEKKFPEVSWGGMYKPPNCTARHKVAIILAYRNRMYHLAIFLNHMHKFLIKQQLEYGIFVIDQYGDGPFNRAKLFNVGFVESNRLKAGGWQCFIFHDVDLLPLDERNMYSCPKQPRHMSASLDTHGNKLLYEEIFGGVSALTYAQFTSVNGFSNRYWGWGGEDDDMAYRIKELNYHLSRYKMSVARYTMLDHGNAPPNPKRYQILSQEGKNFRTDGLSSLRYNVLQVISHHLFTQIIVDISFDNE